MTPTQKAEELYNNMYHELPARMGRHEISKNCALIAVDEILNLCWGGNKVGMKHWQEVKQEIELL